jgi:glucose-1-phosphate adenylyltransferase
MRALALVLAGGEGNRLEVLTEDRAKPAMPFAGVYRLIDFPLSNCMHSGISDVWVVQQYEPHSLNDHIANGRPWDLDKTHGGLRILAPHQGNDEEAGWHQGNADALYRNKSFIEEADPDVVVVLSSDHVYKLDYSDVIAHHADAGADATLVTTRVEKASASRFGVVEVGGGDRVTDYEYKPDHPSSELVTTEVFVFSTTPLLRALETLAEDGDPDDGLGDFGDRLLPDMVAKGAVSGYRLDGYWRDVGTISSYWAAHMDLLTDEPQLDLDDPAWPILTLAPQRPPAHIFESATNINALVSPGSEIRGTVVNSVLAPGVVVEAGATVRDSIVLNDVRIAAGATLERAIIDEGARVCEDAIVGGQREESGTEPTGDDDIVVVGSRARIGPGKRVSAGARVEPGSES